MRQPSTVIWGLLSIIFLVSAPALNTAFAQQDLGQFNHQTDIGNVKHPGSVTYNADKQQYTITGSGSNMWFDHDELHFIWKQLKGDFIIRARVRFLGEGGNPHRKLGWNVRSSLDSTSAHVNAAVHGNGLTSLQFRRTKGDSTGEIKSPVNGPDVIQLERKGNTYIMSAAKFGDTFKKVEVKDINLGDEVYVGLYVCSHNRDISEKAVFSNVRFVQPAGADLVPYQDFLGSNIEIMNVETGDRKILYQSPKSLQAPNWTPDDKALIYNSEGLLYRFNMETQKPKVIDTGFAKNINNDHVLTFDGTMLGISNSSEEDGGVSMVYTVPVTGGTPKRITDKGPSYLHGWSPDGKDLVYVGQRNGDFDIYRMPATGKGQEERLTTAPGLDDGCEYSPDGKYIYFNSVRSGSMEIWRMKTDGSDKEQLTNDEYNNWFAHISPDGKRMVFISFPKTVPPGDHPFYKRVYLRMMPVDGGQPKTIAYLYGGQGTINVPSWSPDGTHIAFVSNSGFIKD